MPCGAYRSPYRLHAGSCTDVMAHRYSHIVRCFPLLLLLAASAGRTQTPGTCAYGRATGVLDANDVEATVYNMGSLFFGWTGQGLYEVPRGSGRSPIFAAGLWVGGRVGTETRLAAATYDDFQFWPGPLEPGGALPNPADCSAYDHVWTVSRADVRAYLRGEGATPDLASWPHELGAPVIDGDGVTGNYNLAGGDQPDIPGEQAAFWVMNDVGNVKPTATSAPMGLEVQVLAFAGVSAIIRQGAPPEYGTPAPDQTTYYRYRLINRSAVPIDDAYAALFMDVDLGNASDDYVGTDTTFGMAFVYNADEFDESATGYGSPPPALGAIVVEGPVGLPNGRDDDRDGSTDEAGERLSLTSSSYFIGGGPAGTQDPSNTTEYYRYLRGLWGDGTPLREDGNGHTGQGRVTPFAFPGDPLTRALWSEENTGSSGRNTPGDRRLAASVGPFRLDPGEAEDLTFALVFAPGSTGRLSAVANLRAWADAARRYTGVEGGRTTLDGGPPPSGPPVPERLALHLPRPNPSTGAATVGYDVPATTRLRLALYDVLGREVAVLADGVTEPGFYEAAVGAGLPPGTYLLRFTTGGAERTAVLTRY